MSGKARCWRRAGGKVTCRLSAAVLACFVGAAAAVTADDVGQPDRFALLLDLRDGAFASLDTELLRWQEQFERRPESASGVEAAFHAFASSDPDLESPLQAWATHEPRSFAALVARGVYYRHLAELSRGNEPLASTAPQRLAEMERYDLLAAADLEAAIALRPRALVAHATLVAIAADHRDDALLGRRADDAVAVLGRTAAVCAAYMGRFDGRRGGTKADLDAFIGTPRYLRLCGSSPADSRYFVEMAAGQAADTTQDVIAAVDHFSIAASLSNGAAPRLARGMTFLHGGWHAGAVAEFERLVAENPDDAEALFRRGLALWHSHRQSEALRDLDAAVAFDPFNPQFLAQRADLLLEQRRVDEAAADLENAVRFGEYDEAVQASRARILTTALQNLPKASRAYERLVQLNPQNSHYWMEFATVLLALRDCRAIAAAATFHSMCPDIGSCAISLDDTFYSRSLEELRIEKNCPAAK